MFIKKEEYGRLIDKIKKLERENKMLENQIDYWKNQYCNAKFGGTSCDDCLNMLGMFANVDIINKEE